MKIDWIAVGKVGLPGVIALFLVYRLAAGFDMFETRLKAIESQHEAQWRASDAQARSSDEAKDLAGRSLMSSERILWVLQVMCANDAKTTDARERCLRGPIQ